MNDKSELSIESVAKVCHEANRAFCQVLGDDSQPAWEDAPRWQQDSAMQGVIAVQYGRVQGPEGSHESWRRCKEQDGWKYGAVKDPAKKEHPCMVAFHELPWTQQLKDHLFYSIAKKLTMVPYQAYEEVQD